MHTFRMFARDQPENHMCFCIDSRTKKLVNYAHSSVQSCIWLVINNVSGTRNRVIFFYWNTSAISRHSKHSCSQVFGLRSTKEHVRLQCVLNPKRVDLCM